MIYYRIAYQTRNETNLKWKSTQLTSLGAVFQILRRYSPLPQDRVRVFMASSPEEMDKQLVQENNELRSHSVTGTQFIQEHMISSQHGISNAIAPRHDSNEISRHIYTHKERELSSLERKQVEPERSVLRGDFWNISALVAA